jgi:hypothetical protein
MSYVLSSTLDIRFRGKVSGDFEARLFRALLDGSKVVWTARFSRSGCLSFLDCAESGMTSKVSFVCVFFRSDMPFSGPEGLRLKRLVTLHAKRSEDWDVFCARKYVSLGGLTVNVLVYLMAKGSADLTEATVSGEESMSKRFLKICAISGGRWEDRRHLLMFNSGKDKNNPSNELHI